MFTILSSFDYIAHDVTFALLRSHSFPPLLPASVNYISTSCLDLSRKWRRTVLILVCSQVCEGSYTHACMWRPEINTVSSSIVFHLRFWSRVSHYGWSSTIQLDWLASESQGPSCLCFPSICPGSSFLHGYSELNLHSKRFTDGVMSLTPHFCLFVTGLFYLGCQNFLLSNTNGPLPICVLFCLCSSLLTLGVPLSLML